MLFCWWRLGNKFKLLLTSIEKVRFLWETVTSCHAVYHPGWRAYQGSFLQFTYLGVREVGGYGVCDVRVAVEVVLVGTAVCVHQMLYLVRVRLRPAVHVDTDALEDLRGLLLPDILKLIAQLSLLGSHILSSAPHLLSATLQLSHYCLCVEILDLHYLHLGGHLAREQEPRPQAEDHAF